jgi:hypothetical protein
MTTDSRPDKPKPPSDAGAIFCELSWFFNDAAADLGLSSSHETLVAMANAGGGTRNVSTDSLEARLERNQFAATRYRLIAEVLHRIPKRAQRDLCYGCERRRWPGELGRHPKEHIRLAAHSLAVRGWFRGDRKDQPTLRGDKHDRAHDLRRLMWSEQNGVLLLVLAEKPPESDDAAAWTRLRIDAWNHAEGERTRQQANRDRRRKPSSRRNGLSASRAARRD